MTEYSDIFKFTDFRRFLADYQEKRQAAEPTFTRTEFCVQLGFTKTRSYFNDIVQGRILSKKMIPRFIEVLNLKGAKALYFEAMVNMNQAKTEAARENALKEMLRINPEPGAILDKDSYTFFSNWYNTIIYTLLDVLNVSENIDELEQKIFPPVPPKKIKESLALMQKMHLIHKNENGFWKPSQDSFTTMQQCKNKMIKQYQKECLELSKQAIDSAGKESLDMTTFTFSLSKKAQEFIYLATEKYKEEIRRIVRTDKNKATEVQHINLHVFSAIKKQEEK